jgi:hypothetical protein
MKVYWPGRGTTYHPRLGKLTGGEEFELADDEAKRWLDSGLLKKAKRTTDDRGRRIDDGGRTTEDGRQTTDDGRRTTDDGRQTTDDRGRRTDTGGLSIDE